MRVRALAAALALLVAVNVAVARPGRAAAESVTDVAGRVANATQALEALQQHRQTVTDQITAVDTEVQRRQARLDEVQRTSSALVAAARQQAVSTYIHGDAANQSYALASALAQADVNDALWSIGVLKVTHDRTVELVHAAAATGGSANRDLTDALARQAALRTEQDRLGPAIDAAAAAVRSAQAALAAAVERVGSTTADGMTTVAYEAYLAAAGTVATESPACGLRWELLAAIGKTESNHGLGRLNAAGDSVVPIIGIPIGADTDAGALDADPEHDHAVGPMQFIPSTWQRWGADGNGDGKADPGNVFDETLAAGRYLCSAASDLTLATRDGVIRAILAYNPNQEYLRVVGARYETLASDVAGGWFSTGDLALPSTAPATVADGGGPPPDLGAGAGTAFSTFTVFGPSGVMVPTSGEVVAADCIAPSSVLGGRTGFVRCTPQAPDGPAPALDPCVVSPTDPTLVACVSDPRAPVRLLRSTAPLTAPATMPAPPYLAMVLTGDDLCLPVAPAADPADTYHCASGLTVVGQPDTSSATWQVRVTQPGGPERTLGVIAAWA